MVINKLSRCTIFATDSVEKLRFTLRHMTLITQTIYLLLALFVFSGIGLLVCSKTKKTSCEVEEDELQDSKQETIELERDIPWNEKSEKGGNTTSHIQPICDDQLNDLTYNEEVLWFQEPDKGSSASLGSLESGADDMLMCGQRSMLSVRRSLRPRRKPQWISDTVCFGCPTQCRI